MLSNLGLDSNCLETMTVSPSFIKDKESGCCEQSTSSNWDVRVEFNPNESVQFVKIDKCVFDDGHGKRCDCAIFDKNLAYFVEIKELTDFDSRKKRNSRRRSAKQQLISTINDFREMGKLDMTKVRALIALSPALEENIPNIIQVTQQSEINYFLDECGCPNIYRGNLVSFK